MARHNEQGNNSNVLSMISIALILKLDDTVTSLSTLLAAQNKFNLHISGMTLLLRKFETKS